MSNKSRLPHTIDEMFEESKNRLGLERESMIQNIKDDLTTAKNKTLSRAWHDWSKAANVWTAYVDDLNDNSIRLRIRNYLIAISYIILEISNTAIFKTIISALNIPWIDNAKR